MPEDIIMLRTMQALIQPKLVHRDLPLFAALLSDLFPGLEAPGPPADALRQAVEAELRSNNLQVIRDRFHLLRPMSLVGRQDKRTSGQAINSGQAGLQICIFCNQNLLIKICFSE